MTLLTEPQRQDARKHAGQALQYARAGNWAGVSSHVQTVIDNYGLQGIHAILLGVADTVIVRQGVHKPGGAVMPAFYDTTEHKVTAADDTPARIRWAGRFLAARATENHEQCQGLLDSCTSVDGLLEGVSGLFEIAAETLNRVQPTMRMGGE